MTKIAQFKGVIGFIILLLGVTLAFVSAESSARKTDLLAKQSAITRVHTVQQRCDLTKKIITGVNFRSPKDQQGLEMSLVKCQKQLLEVEKIAKNAR